MVHQKAELTPATVRRAMRLRPVEREVIDLFVRMAALLRLPRSVGEIYGLLFLSPRALPMDAVRERLQLSKGGTSMGLRTLRTFGAVQVVYRPGDRREHYAAETELRKLAAGFLRDQLEPHLHSGRDRLVRIQEGLKDLPPEEVEHLGERVQRLQQWRNRAEKTLPLVLKMIRS